MRVFRGRTVFLALMLILSLASTAWPAEGERTFAAGLLRAADLLVKGKPYTEQDVSLVRDRSGEQNVRMRAWLATQYVVLRAYEDTMWRRGRVTHFWTDDPALTFGSKLKVGATLAELRALLDNAARVSVDSARGLEQYAVSLDGGATVTFDVRDGTIASITYVSAMPISERMRSFLPSYQREPEPPPPPRTPLPHELEPQGPPGGLPSPQSGLMGALVAGEGVGVRNVPGGRVLFRVSASRGDYLIVRGTPVKDEAGEEWYQVTHRYVERRGRGALEPRQGAYVTGRLICLSPLSTEDWMMLRQ